MQVFPSLLVEWAYFEPIWTVWHRYKAEQTETLLVPRLYIPPLHCHPVVPITITFDLQLSLEHRDPSQREPLPGSPPRCTYIGSTGSHVESSHEERQSAVVMLQRERTTKKRSGESEVMEAMEVPEGKRNMWQTWPGKIHFCRARPARRRTENFSGAVLNVAVTWWKYSLWKEK